MSFWSLCRCVGDMEHPIPVASQPGTLNSIEVKPGWTQQGEVIAEGGHRSQTGVLKTSHGKSLTTKLSSTRGSDSSQQSSESSTLKVQTQDLPGVIRFPSEMESGPPVDAQAAAGSSGADSRMDGNGAQVPIERRYDQGKELNALSTESGAAHSDLSFPGNQRFFERLGNLRDRSLGKWLPEGKCVYIQSGDPSDFDGYLIAQAGQVLSQMTENMTFAVVVPEERAENRNVDELDERAEVSMDICGRMLRHLCPTACVVRGPLNERNIFALMNAPEKYHPAVATVPTEDFKINWTSVKDLVDIVNDPEVTSVVLDLMGSTGFMKPLIKHCPDLPRKVLNSSFAIPLMCGVLAERAPQTLKVAGRDPRAGMNCIYHKPREILDLARVHNVQLLFVSNNCTNNILRFDDDVELVRELGLSGLLRHIASCWFAPHLKGRYVVFDWVALGALLLYQRDDSRLTVEDRELWVGETDCSVMVLKKPEDPMNDIVQKNLEGTTCYGVYKSVVDMDRTVLLELARELRHHC